MALQFRGEATAIPKLFDYPGVTVLKEEESFATGTERLIVFCYDLASIIDFDALKTEIKRLQPDHKIILLGLNDKAALKSNITKMPV